MTRCCSYARTCQRCVVKVVRTHEGGKIVFRSYCRRHFSMTGLEGDR